MSNVKRLLILFNNLLLSVISFVFCLQFIIKDKINLTMTETDGPTSILAAGKISPVIPLIIMVLSVISIIFSIILLVQHLKNGKKKAM